LHRPSFSEASDREDHFNRLNLSSFAKHHVSRRTPLNFFSFLFAMNAPLVLSRFVQPLGSSLEDGRGPGLRARLCVARLPAVFWDISSRRPLTMPAAVACFYFADVHSCGEC